MTDFYKWDEIDLNDTTTFNWKTYYYFTGINNNSWLEPPMNEKLVKYHIKDIIKLIIEKEIN